MTHWWHQPLKCTRCISAASQRWIVDGTDTLSFIYCIHIKVCVGLHQWELCYLPTSPHVLEPTTKKNTIRTSIFARWQTQTQQSDAAQHVQDTTLDVERKARIQSINWTFHRNNGATHDRGMKIQTQENSNYPSTPQNKKIILNCVFCLCFILDPIKRWYQAIWSEFC